MALTAEQETRLLGAIETDSLVFLCGAGLSMPQPSNLLSAVTVAQKCYDRWQPTEQLDPALRNDVDQLAGYFFRRGDFKKVFISRLVPWNELVGSPNDGHAAIADLLISRGARAALSANFDPLIESWAEEHKVALQGALTGQEAADYTANTNPLIKFHGCIRSREGTLWTKAQLTDSTIQERIDSCSQWMNIHLPNKHLVVVGFWTDWGYLNEVLARAFGINNASSVMVVDPSSAATLQAKAPELWAKLSGQGIFDHVQASGVYVLDELRTAFSKVWARKFYRLGQPLMQADGGVAPYAATPDALTGEDLYKLRQDAEGIPYYRAAKKKEPDPAAAQTAFAHMILLNAGATQQGAWLEYSGRSIRIVNGAGQGLTQVKEEFKEPTTFQQSEIVVCAGATELGVPAKLIASGRGASMVRPSSGGMARWLTLDQARLELSI